MATCFVIQGFNTKPDYATGRVLDLDASYEVIREAVIEAGLECIRADEIRHSGSIDKPMFDQILSADLVIADLSTSNVNAAYELGVRHALRPFATIIVAEKEFKYPFDFSHIAIQSYEHLGKDIGRREAERFKKALVDMIREIAPKRTLDSPVYEFLKPLAPPTREEKGAVGATLSVVAPARAGVSVKEYVDRARAAMKKKDFAAARADLMALLQELKVAEKASGLSRAPDCAITQMLALATYKSRQPTEEAALQEARAILQDLNPKVSLDPETLGLWGAVHKRLWEIGRAPEVLDEAVRSYGRGFELKHDYYTGVNYAFVLNTRSKHSSATNTSEAIADWVLAARVRKEVQKICLALEPGVKHQLETSIDPDEADLLRREYYWILATLREVAFALADPVASEDFKKRVAANVPSENDKWMIDSTDDQIANLAPLLADPPTARIVPR
jgi:hypothetical protein